MLMDYRKGCIQSAPSLEPTPVTHHSRAGRAVAKTKEPSLTCLTSILDTRRVA